MLRNRSIVVAVISALTWLSLLGHFGASAQTVETVAPGASAANSDSKTAMPPAVKTLPAAEEVKPEILYLRDKENRLVPTPGISYEDFVELFRLKAQLAKPAAGPRFNLHQLTIAGEVRGQNAELQIKLKLSLNETGWQQIPLGLAQAALKHAAVYEGDGEYYLQFDRELKQFVVWLRGEKKSEHRLTMTTLVPLTAKAGGTRLELNLPTATTSQLTLRVPQADLLATSPAEGPAPEVASISDQISEITALGIGGQYRLDWSSNDRPTARQPVVLESNGVLLVKIDGRSVTNEATLTVRSFGAEFDQFRVKLPKGSVLVGGQQTGYTLTSTGTTAAPLVEVKLAQKTVGPIDVKIIAERAYDITKPSETLELAGFEVVEAVAHRQGGQIGVVVTGDWQVIWDKRVRVRQIDEAVDAFKRKDLFAVFEYVGQPCSILARVVPRKTRVTVDPELVYLVDANETVLEARLKYNVRGAKVFGFDLDLSGWDIDEIGPVGIVDLASLATGEDARLRIPLLQPSTGDIEITLRARRRHSVSADGLELSLPVLQADTVNPATVAIVPADNVELVTQAEAVMALSPQRGTPGIRLPIRQQAALLFRAERSPAKYVAQVTVHERKTAVQVSSQVQIAEQLAKVEQRVQYEILYEPVDRLNFEVPRNLLLAGQISVLVGGRSLNATLVADDETNELVRYQVLLAQPSIGSVEVNIRYAVPLERLQPAATEVSDVPLMMPIEGRMLSNTLRLMQSPNYKVDVRPGVWAARTNEVVDTGKLFEYSADQRATVLPLSIGLDEQRVPGSTVVDRAWVQTWLTPPIRQERAVFQVQSNDTQLHLTMPVGVSLSDMEVVCDGKPVAPVVSNHLGLTIPLRSVIEGARHTIDLRYRYQDGSPSRSRIRFARPEFANDVRVRRLYWQLIVPADQHLVINDAGLTPEFVWLGQAIGWQRDNLLSQTQLETWTGALAEPAVPAALNSYLFSLPGQSGDQTVLLAGRSLLVLAASSGLLLVGLVLIYLPRLRHPATLGVGIVVLFALVLAYPEPALLIGQAAVLGLFLSILALLLFRATQRRRLQTPQSVASRSSIMSRSPSDVLYRPSPPASAGSTATAAISLVRPVSESQAR